MRRLKRLPKSCAEAATWLKRDGKYYEADHIFPRVVVEETVRKLRSYKDSDLAAKVKEEPLKVEKLMQSFLFCG
jgi:glutamine synthetase